MRDGELATSARELTRIFRSRDRFRAIAAKPKMPRDLAENLGSIFEPAAIDDADRIFLSCETEQPIDELGRLETAFHIARHHIGGGERAGIEVVEEIGDERTKARAPRCRRQRPS